LAACRWVSSEHLVLNWSAGQQQLTEQVCLCKTPLTSITAAMISSFVRLTLPGT
jgi:hypothetical protein